MSNLKSEKQVSGGSSFLSRLSGLSSTNYRLANTFNFSTPERKLVAASSQESTDAKDDSSATSGITESLIQGLLASNVQHTLVEQERPTLTKATTNHVKDWISKVYSYRDRKGVEPFYQLIGPEALNLYMFCSGFQSMKDASDDELIAWLRKYHHLDPAKTVKMVYSLSMKDTTVFSKESTEAYLQDFITLSKREAASLQGIEEEQICHEFVGGLSPPELKTYFRSLKLKTIEEIITALSDFFVEAAVAESFNSKVLHTRSSSTKRSCPHPLVERRSILAI